MNLSPYLTKLSKMFLRLRTTNIITMRLMNPLYFCVVDYPDKIETCLTSLGLKERQLLYFLEGQSPLISLIHFYVDLIVTTYTTSLVGSDLLWLSAFL